MDYEEFKAWVKNPSIKTTSSGNETSVTVNNPSDSFSAKEDVYKRQMVSYIDVCLRYFWPFL